MIPFRIYRAGESDPFIKLFDELPKGKGQRDNLNAEMTKWRAFGWR